jgi:hypothetical protein
MTARVQLPEKNFVHEPQGTWRQDKMIGDYFFLISGVEFWVLRQLLAYCTRPG